MPASHPLPCHAALVAASPFPRHLGALLLRHPDAVGGRVQSNLVIAYNTFIYKFILENFKHRRTSYGK